MLRDWCEDGILAKPGEYSALNFLKGAVLHIRVGWKKGMGKVTYIPPFLKRFPGNSTLLTNFISQNLVTWSHIAAKETWKCRFFSFDNLLS